MGTQEALGEKAERAWGWGLGAHKPLLRAHRAGDRAPWLVSLGQGAWVWRPQQTLWFSPRTLVLSIPGPVTGASPTAAVCIPDDIAGGGAWAGVTGVLLWLPPPAPQPLCLAGCGGVLGGLVHAQVS